MVRRRVKRGKEGLGCVSLPPSGAHLPSPQQSRTVRSGQELRLRSRTSDSPLSPTINHFPPPHDRAAPRELFDLLPTLRYFFSPTFSLPRSCFSPLPFPPPYSFSPHPSSSYLAFNTHITRFPHCPGNSRFIGSLFQRDVLSAANSRFRSRNRRHGGYRGDGYVDVGGVVKVVTVVSRGKPKEETPTERRRRRRKRSETERRRREGRRRGRRRRERSR